MTDKDFDDHETCKQWCIEQREVVSKYLDKEGCEHEGIAKWPAWDVPPLIAVWEVQSKASPGITGWWAISGDLPTTYISSTDIDDERDAVRAFVQKWQGLVDAWAAGENPIEYNIGGGEKRAELGPLLESRIGLLTDIADDDSNWE